MSMQRDYLTNHNTNQFKPKPVLYSEAHKMET